MIVNIVYVLQIDAVEKLDLTPLSLAIAGIFYAFSIFRYHFLDVNTLARSALVEQVPEGILVLNAENIIIDMNPAAEK